MALSLLETAAQYDLRTDEILADTQVTCRMLLVLASEAPLTRTLWSGVFVTEVPARISQSARFVAYNTANPDTDAAPRAELIAQLLNMLTVSDAAVGWEATSPLVAEQAKVLSAQHPPLATNNALRMLFTTLMPLSHTWPLARMIDFDLSKPISSDLINHLVVLRSKVRESAEINSAWLADWAALLRRASFEAHWRADDNALTKQENAVRAVLSARLCPPRKLAPRQSSCIDLPTLVQQQSSGSSKASAQQPPSAM